MPGIEAETEDSASVAFGWDGSVRGRFGYLASPTVLVYGTGGIAFQQLSVGATCDGGNGSWCGFTLGIVGPQRSESVSTVRAGWTVGAGLEGVLTGNWLGKLEFRYADFGQFDHAFFAGTADEVDTSVHAQTYTFLAGIGYKFNGPVSVPGSIVAPTSATDIAFKSPRAPTADPWTGCYAGGNAGDVWGSSAFNWTNLTNAGFGAAAPLIPAAANATLDDSVFTAGGQIGCDYQTDGIVSGLEGDFEYTGLAANRSAVSLGNTNGGPPTIVPGSISESFSAPGYRRSVAGWVLQTARGCFTGQAAWQWRTCSLRIRFASRLPRHQVATQRRRAIGAQVGRREAEANGKLIRNGALGLSTSMPTLAAPRIPRPTRYFPARPSRTTII